MTVKRMVLALMMTTSALWGAPDAYRDDSLALRRMVPTWMQATQLSMPPDAWLEVHRSHCPVERNARWGKPLNIARRAYASGIYTHAPSRITVHLGSPGRQLDAAVGVHSNEQTASGMASVRFSIVVRGERVYHSDVRKEGMPALPLRVNLKGADCLDLEVDDADDGIHSDQAVWADARVTLSDGSILKLGDLPVVGGPQAVSANTAVFPFTFIYNGVASDSLLPEWPSARHTRRLDDTRTETTRTWTDPASGLEVRCVSVEYADFPTIEWTLYFRNTGSTDTPILEQIQPLDMRFARYADPSSEYVLHHNRGTLVTTINVPAGQRDFEPLTTTLSAGVEQRFAPPQGRPCAGDWPYFNLAWGGGGLIMVVGWPGAWDAGFTRDAGEQLHVQAGQQRTRLRLHPGEEIRTPLIVLQRYSGDWLKGQNIWRRWMWAHNLPRPNGEMLQPFTAAFCGYYFPDLTITANGEKQAIDRYAEERLLPDAWWVDAGWYKKTDPDGNDSWTITGTWEPDPERFPDGLKPVFEYARARGIPKGVLWFEPERVAPGSWLYRERPEWLLGPDGQYKLLNLGHPEALQWCIDMVDRTLNEARITIYREDFNFGPLNCWRHQEPDDRQGINEIKHVVGHLAFWKELLRRDPRRLIDTCASGGHRLDLETLRLSVPLWRTDYPWEPVGQQCQTYGISLWIPYHGTGVVSDDPYILRSDMAPFFLMSWDMNRPQDFSRLRALMAEWKRLAPHTRGDFYPLTDYSVGETVWMAWQYNQPETRSGAVQVFRRDGSPYETARMVLRGLDESARYRITHLSTGRTLVMTGKALMTKGMPVTMRQRPEAATWEYRVVD